MIPELEPARVALANACDLAHIPDQPTPSVGIFNRTLVAQFVRLVRAGYDINLTVTAADRSRGKVTVTLPERLK